MRPDILTSTGTYFDFEQPWTCEISIEQIADSLSKICRFTGHCRDFYSVAQHSVLVSRIVPAEIALEGLLHDAAEAFIGDVSKPLKVLLPDYRQIEARVEAAVFSALGITLPMPIAVKHADLVALATEQRDLMPKAGGLWTTLKGVTPHPEEILPAGPWSARMQFMDRYHELKRVAA